MKKIVLLLLTGFLIPSIWAQDTTNHKKIEKLLGGYWYNRSAKRHLTIDYDGEYACFNITDHIKGYSTDAYHAYAKDNLLVMYAQNKDHHCSYCEVSLSAKELVYECNDALNFTDQFLNRQKNTTKMVFKKRKR